jgi:hypothetical protein
VSGEVEFAVQAPDEGAAFKMVEEAFEKGRFDNVDIDNIADMNVHETDLENADEIKVFD